MSEKSNKTLQKPGNFFKKFPVIISLIVVIPSLIYMFANMFTIEEYYYHYYYDGEFVDINAEQFKITGIKKVANVYQAATMFSYQGGACYEEYYLIVTDNFESIIIYNTDNMKVEHVIDTGITNTDWHCNQCFFGNDFFSVHDKFPVLYVSMESSKVLSTIGFRIYQNGGDYYVKRISTFKLFFDDNRGPLYYPNAFYDHQSKIMYYVGYTKKNSYVREEGNFLRYYSFYMPDYRTEMDGWFTSQCLDVFDLPAETAAQGGTIINHYLYQTFGNDKDPTRLPTMKVIDLEKKKVVYGNITIGKDLGIHEELEHVAINSNGKMYTLGNPFNIYEFEWTDK